jgi:ribonucleoside-diphosphate reductase beta chain
MARLSKATIFNDVDYSTGDDLDAVGFDLYRKAIRVGTWNPDSIDLTQDKRDLESLDERHLAYLHRFCAAFYNAEENVAKEFCPWVMAGQTFWQQAFLSTQLVEEFKHAQFFARYFDEVFGHRNWKTALANPVHDSLGDRADVLRRARDADPQTLEMTFVEGLVHYQGVIEGVQAMGGYGIFYDVYMRKGLFPGLAQGFKNINQDEGRHVGFGLRALRYFARKDKRYAQRIREMYEEYLPLIKARYGSPFVVNGKQYDPPEEERGQERLMALYNRRLQDIFA